MNKINEIYPHIDWITNKSGELKKENYDACDSLVCALAYVNVNRYGLTKPQIKQCIVEKNDKNGTNIHYTMEMWGKNYEKDLTLYKSN